VKPEAQRGAWLLLTRVTGTKEFSVPTFKRHSRGAWLAACAVAALAALLTDGADTHAAESAACGSNPIVCENQLPGSPQSEWDLPNGLGAASIVGFATDISVNHGQTVRFKVKTTASAYHIDIYRLGYYGGLGARKVTTIRPTAGLPQTQPSCKTQSSTGLVDCGNWHESAHWDVAADAVSGVYIAKLVRDDNGEQNHMVFVVRDDEGHSDVLLQTSDETWEAYNRYGGNSLYVGSPAGRAYKVSYNRPFTTRDYANPSWLFGQEYPMIRWLERNGYDMSYTTDVDSARRKAELLEHKVFLSVGHDEYWSAEQRANVEAARDGGVSLGFFSGNEVFWKTRWEQSIDGSATPFRTLVSYKETKDGAKIDPNSAWTGTWRDKRFSPPSDGGRPENALTGTLFAVDAYRQDAMTVPAEYAHFRLWRNTSIANLAPGDVATIAAGILGHEWDEDVDNGARPPGLIRLSSTTVAVDKHLIDEGNTYVPGTATHNLTMYRAPSGALVFGAGTAQWSWALDGTHDYFLGSTPRSDGDSRIQQATVNLLADMKAQPATLQAGLVAATASTDTIAPASSISAPTPGTVVASGTVVTIRGAASDSGGGSVAGVEVSTDGSTWHPATGRENWMYTWTVGGIGNVTIRSRAIDDSGNIETNGGSTITTVACPCSLWSGGTLPTTPSSTDSSGVEVGLKFRVLADGYVTGLRFYKGLSNTGTHVGSLWTVSGALLTRATFTSETASGWQDVAFDTAVPVTTANTYVASYYAPNGHYAVDPFYFSSSGFTNPPLSAPADGAVGGNGVFAYGATPRFPNGTYKSGNYWVDVIYNTAAPADTKPPTVSTRRPAPGGTGTDIGSSVSATFNEAIDAATVSTATLDLRTAGGALVPATVSYDASSRTATLQPSALLAYSADYRVTVHGGAGGITDLAGNALTSDDTWSFTTAAPRTCPCTIWDSSATPATASVGDAQSVELGVRFRPDTDGYISAIRFYKGSRNTGTHTGSLWANNGTLLAQGTFAGETSSGWQELTLGDPVPVRAGTTYVASYHAPNGGYSVSPSYFAGSSYASSPLRALKDGLDGPNGAYVYGSATAFPTQSSNSTNYWVDVVYLTTPPADTRPPSVTATTPPAGAPNAAATADVTATFSEALNPSTVNASTFSLHNSSGTIAASVSYDAATKTATLHPSAPLAYGASYTATVQGGPGGVTDAAGNPLASDFTWSFSTKACPCTLFSATSTPGIDSSGDVGSVELGVKFQADVDGYVSGIRFYKGSRNSGEHVGSLWTSTGVPLGRITFTSETPAGWQQANFDGPIRISANTTYVASYHAPAGGYSTTGSFFANGSSSSPPLVAPGSAAAGGNGVYAYGGSPSFPTQSFGATNYWVDVVFQTTRPADSTPPRVESVSPADGSQAPRTTRVIATFSEAIDASTVDGTHFQLRDSGGALVPADISYDASTRTATLTPQAELASGGTYTALVKGGSGGVADVAGNVLSADKSWSFTTKGCPCSLFSPTAVPEVSSSGDTQSVELGMKFRADAAGFVSGIRFYKGANNTGTHTGSLWTSGGTLLGRTTFLSETASGWQQANFSTAIPIDPNTTYVVSYFAPNGGYAVDPFFFGSPFQNSPLLGLADGTDGGNGVYAYGATSTFPTATNKSSSYGVDLVFTSS
jgi:hypothetical protein